MDYSGGSPSTSTPSDPSGAGICEREYRTETARIFNTSHSQHTHMSEKKRVQFRAPQSLVDRADSLAEVLDTDRTDVLIDALRDYLREAAHDDEVKQEIADAYYDDRITFDELADLVGHEEAANFRVLKEQLETDAEELADV